LNRYRISNQGEIIDYEVVHRPAVTRRLHLELGENGQLQVVAPRRWSRKAIHSTLQQRAQHVARFLARARSRLQELPEYRYVNGEAHLFMGKRYPLNIREPSVRRTTIELRDGQILIATRHTGNPGVRSLLEKWYRRQSAEQFAMRLSAFSQAANWVTGQPPEMRLRKMKRTWGSCSSKGVITLNPHLVKAPESCIDYVIAHEVCHLQELNHGKAFYALQEQLFPSWREAKTHLRNQGHIYLV
jgi:predicted metal-dependent hydrolase